MKVIRSNALVPGYVYGMAFYDSKNVVHRGVLISRPHSSVNDMTKADRFVFKMEETGENIEFFKNACFPYYLETKREGRSKRLRNCRVTFYEVEQPAITMPEIKAESETAVSSALVVYARPRIVKQSGHPIETPEVIYLSGSVYGSEKVEDVAEADPKPVRVDGENFGTYQKRLKAWKKRNKKLVAA